LTFPDLEKTASCAAIYSHLISTYRKGKMPTSRTGVGMRITERLDGNFSVDGMPPHGAAALSGQVQVVAHNMLKKKFSSQRLPSTNLGPRASTFSCMHACSTKTMMFKPS
jgi:hypothetical protein